MDPHDQIEVVRRTLDHLVNDRAPQWERVRSGMQWMLFWTLAKAIFLFWLIYVALTMMSSCMNSY